MKKFDDGFYIFLDKILANSFEKCLSDTYGLHGRVATVTEHQVLLKKNDWSWTTWISVNKNPWLLASYSRHVAQCVPYNISM